MQRRTSRSTFPSLRCPSQEIPDIFDDCARNAHFLQRYGKRPSGITRGGHFPHDFIFCFTITDHFHSFDTGILAHGDLFSFRWIVTLGFMFSIAIQGLREPRDIDRNLGVNESREVRGCGVRRTSSDDEDREDSV